MLKTLLLCVLSAAFLRADSLYLVALNTTALDGTNGDLVVDFISGGGPEQNAISIAGFMTDGTLGTPSPTGDVFGTLPSTVIMVTDPVNSAFNEYLTGITFGTEMSFYLDVTTNAPGTGSAPDEVSLYLLGTDGMTSLVTTDDPTSADALLTVDIDGSANGIPTTYNVLSPSGVSTDMTFIPQQSGGGGNNGGSPSPVPEPAPLPIAAWVWLFWMYRYRKPRGRYREHPHYRDGAGTRR
jgi:hypothetical protein